MLEQLIAREGNVRPWAVYTLWIGAAVLLLAAEAYGVMDAAMMRASVERGGTQIAYLVLLLMLLPYLAAHAAYRHWSRDPAIRGRGGQVVAILSVGLVFTYGVFFLMASLLYSALRLLAR